MASTGVDYAKYESGGLAFDYEGLLASVPWSFDDLRQHSDWKVGRTPLFELHGINRIIQKMAGPGRGARVFMKDEAANASGSFKARRASLAVQLAKARGYQGVVAATSGNYGAAVASQAAMQGLDCIVVQETFDSRDRAQPEILEKARACEAYGAEVLQLTVGPELFLMQQQVLEETGFFNASLYAPYSILGIETLGYEIVEDAHRQWGTEPDVVIVSHAGGGNVTGTARGMRRAGAKDTQVVAASVNLAGLHMAKDSDFNRKSFTTSHTGFGVPFTVRPDRVDLPRSAARPLRYLDRYVTVEQGEVFYATELLAVLDGLERGPAGCTALAAAIPIAAQLPADQTVVVQESEYTGAGKSHMAQLSFARDNGIRVTTGDREDSRPGQTIVIPPDPGALAVDDIDMDGLRRRYLSNMHMPAGDLSEQDLAFLAQETRLSPQQVRRIIAGRAHD